MPIDRPATDERPRRHWCDPASEQPDERGTWTCTCGKTWILGLDGVWTTLDIIIANGPGPAAPVAEEEGGDEA